MRHIDNCSADADRMTIRVRVRLQQSLNKHSALFDASALFAMYELVGDPAVTEAQLLELEEALQQLVVSRKKAQFDAEADPESIIGTTWVGSRPATPKTGDTYFDEAKEGAFIWTGKAWVKFTSASVPETTSLVADEPKALTRADLLDEFRDDLCESHYVESVDEDELARKTKILEDKVIAEAEAEVRRRLDKAEAEVKEIREIAKQVTNIMQHEFADSSEPSKPASRFRSWIRRSS